MDFEKKMYEVKEKWETAYFSEQDSKRVKFIQNLIPKDAHSILDIGCGNGILVNFLKAYYDKDFDRICGTDRSSTSLSFVETEKQEASIDNLPFKDNEFDIVTCLEVIEHLPQGVYSKALNEIQRIAKKYIIVSVPYNEDLEYSKIKCIKCFTEFNPFYHMQSFDEKKVTKLFNQYDSVEFKQLYKVEETIRPRFKHLKKAISRKLNPNVFSSACICPLCGYNEFDKLKKTKSTNVETNDLNKTKGLSKYWLYYKESKWIAGFYNKL